MRDASSKVTKIRKILFCAYAGSSCYSPCDFSRVARMDSVATYF